MIPRARASHDESRDRICHVAEALFRQLGYVKTTVADIAQALGMSSANVYRFYPSKSAINDAICRRILSELRAGMRALATGPGSPPARIGAMLMEMHRHHKTQLTQEKRVFDMVMAAMDENWEAVEEHLAACGQQFARVIAEGQAGGMFGPGDPAELAEMVMKSCVFAFHPMLIADCGDEDMEPLVRRLSAFALRALSNPQAETLP